MVPPPGSFCQASKDEPWRGQNQILSSFPRSTILVYLDAECVSDNTTDDQTTNPWLVLTETADGVSALPGTWLHP